MFTGIVEELGALRSRVGGRLVLDAAMADELAIGDSVAVNGCCLTVVAKGAPGEGWWAADAVAETLSRTNLGHLAAGDAVNLERPLRLSDRLGGHLVQGHVDAAGEVLNPAPELVVGLAEPLVRYVVEKGSVTLDGVSLTVVEAGEDRVGVAVIPHTAAVTTLGRRRVGDLVNVEVDMLAKHVERLLSAGTRSGRLLVGGDA